MTVAKATGSTLEFQRQLLVMEESVAAMRERAREALRKAWPPVL